jgi:hypothetical protein
MKALKLFVAVFAVAALASCGGKNGPDSVVKDYLTALKDKNVAKAKELGTKETQEMLESMSKMNMLPEVTEVKDIKCTEKENEATCTFCCMKDKTELKLVKEGEKWLVKDQKEMGAPAADSSATATPDSSAAAAPAEAAPAAH